MACPGPGSRREFMQVGALALGGLTLADLAYGGPQEIKPANKSVILFWCYGGPTHLETYDLKPLAPSEYRSVYKPIPTNVAGLDICELFPRQAKLADRFSVIRSLHHKMDSHSDGHIHVLTGKPPSRPDPTSMQHSEHPDFGMVAGKVHGPHPSALPRYVAIPGAVYYTRPTYLGVEQKPFEVGDPSAEKYAPPMLKLGVEAKALDDRRGLLMQFDRLRRHLDLKGAMEGTDKFRASAFQMLTHPQIAQAFDLTKESPALRDRYGRHVWGQSCLLARRLAEAGASVISILSGAAKQGYEYTNWDDHPGNNGRDGHFAKYLATRLPYMDEALAALIEDIYQRGLQRNVMLVVVGEFGRTPMLRKGPPNGSIGRDHWPQAYSALVSGGGLRMGQVVGATNAKGEYPSQRPLTPGDLLATIYRHLGVDYRREFVDFSGRPVPILPQGEPIAELV